MRRQIINRGIRFARTATGPYARKISNRNFARAAARGVKTVPDALWNIEDPTTCNISNGVITWNRTTSDSFIYLEVPASFAVNQTWVVSYTVLNDGGQGDVNGIFCSSASTLFPSTGIAAGLGNQSQEYTPGIENPRLLRWTPNALYNGQTLQINNVKVYDKYNPYAYP